MNEVANVGDKRMTVREIAETTSIPERTIHNAIDRIFPGLKRNGLTTMLTEEQASAVIVEVKRSHNTDLASSGKVITTKLEMQRKVAEAMAWLASENEQLAAQLEEAQPKIEFFDQVADSKTALQMRDVAAALNIPNFGRNKLFSFLRDNEVLDDKNLPYRKYQDAGYFRVVEQSWVDADGESHINLKTLVYQKGVEYIQKLINRSMIEGTPCLE